MPTGGQGTNIVPFTRPSFCNGYNGSVSITALLEKVTNEGWEGDYRCDASDFDFVLLVSGSIELMYFQLCYNS